MKELKTLFVSFILVASAAIFASHKAEAIDKPGRNTPSVLVTGDNMLYTRVILASTTASSLASYSSGRGALTCVNSDTTNTVYIGSSTNIVAQSAGSFPLFAKQSIQTNNNAAMFGIADIGVSSTVIYCITEN